MRIIWHDEYKSATCFGTHDEHREQHTWWYEGTHENIVVGDELPWMGNEGVLWHVWNEYYRDDMTEMLLWKLKYGGQ